jgi:putative FmdB family regulatory protein
MALYGYVYESCGPFEEWAAIAVAAEPCACPGCGATSERQLSVPNLALMNSSLRRALQRGDHTATDPRVVERNHLAGCGCSMCSLRRGPKPSSRRWAIGH